MLWLWNVTLRRNICDSRFLANFSFFFPILSKIAYDSSILIYSLNINIRFLLCPVISTRIQSCIKSSIRLLVAFEESHTMDCIHLAERMGVWKSASRRRCAQLTFLPSRGSFVWRIASLSQRIFCKVPIAWREVVSTHSRKKSIHPIRSFFSRTHVSLS